MSTQNLKISLLNILSILMLMSFLTISANQSSERLCIIDDQESESELKEIIEIAEESSPEETACFWKTLRIISALQEESAFGFALPAAQASWISQNEAAFVLLKNRIIHYCCLKLDC